VEILSMVMAISSEAQVTTESVETITSSFNPMQTPIGDLQISMLDPMETTTLEMETDSSQVMVTPMPEMAISSEVLTETSMWVVEIPISDPTVMQITVAMKISSSTVTGIITLDLLIPTLILLEIL
jgi:hypothetical protein